MQLATAFSRALRIELEKPHHIVRHGPDLLAEVNRRNREVIAYQFRETRPGLVTRSCASHDFCDANEVMADAWAEVMIPELDVANEDHCNLWADAWDTARDASFMLGGGA